MLANQLSFFLCSFELSLPPIFCIGATTRSLKNILLLSKIFLQNVSVKIRRKDLVHFIYCLQVQ